MIKNIYLILLTVLSLQSCNYALMVPKENVITNITGYFIIIDNQGFFVESHDSTYNLDKIIRHINGSEICFSRVSNQNLKAFKLASHKIEAKIFFDSTAMYYKTDTLYYTFSRLKKFPSNNLTLPGKNYLYFSVNNKFARLQLNYNRENLLYLRPELKSEEQIFNSAFW